jgi:hypothetical protein
MNLHASVAASRFRSVPPGPITEETEIFFTGNKPLNPNASLLYRTQPISAWSPESGEHSMPTIEEVDAAEQDLEAALSNGSKILGAAVPRLITEKPQVFRNALKNGVTGKTVFLRPEDLRSYLINGSQTIDDMQPISFCETQLVQQIIDTNWRYNTVIALSSQVHECHVILESQALCEVNPDAHEETIEAHAQARAIQKQCEGSNTLEKLGRQETRLRRAIRELRRDYYEMVDRKPRKAQREEWDPGTSRAFRWYQELAAITTNLLNARSHLDECVEVVLEPPATPSESTVSSETPPQSVVCKKTLRFTGPPHIDIWKALRSAFRWNLLTDLEVTLFPLPDPVPEFPHRL